MSPQVDLSTWLTTAQVAAQLGISERTLDREVLKGLWQVRNRPVPGRRPQRVFHPDQVAAKVPPPPIAVVRGSHAVSQRENRGTGPRWAAYPEAIQREEPLNMDISATRTQLAEMPLQLPEEPPMSWSTIAAFVQAAIEELHPKPQALWIRLKEASEITGLSVTLLRRAIKAQQLPAVRDQATKVRREGLETFDPTAKPKKGPRK